MRGRDDHRPLPERWNGQDDGSPDAGRRLPHRPRLASTSARSQRDHLAPVFEEDRLTSCIDVLAVDGVQTFWLQFGLFDEDVARRAEAGRLEVGMGRCDPRGELLLFIDDAPGTTSPKTAASSSSAPAAVPGRRASSGPNGPRYLGTRDTHV